MSWIFYLPTVNASLNSLCTVLLVVGYILVRQRRLEAHRKVMLAAITVSALFLLSYVVYHWHHGSTPFPHQGYIRVVYFFILITHIILAAAIVPLVLITLSRALRRDFTRHRRIARWTFPIWLYVSVTGVLVYVLLYHWPL